MLNRISKSGAMKAFYYLMAIDGISDEEQECFHAIGLELYGEDFSDIEDQIIQACNDQMNSIDADDNRYDIIQEGIDAALSDPVLASETDISSRLLLWDMLTLAYSDSDCGESENRLISHVARVLETDKSVLLEMKQLIMTASSLQEENELLAKSDRPYAEIRPVIDANERRQATVMEAAKALIADDEIVENTKPSPLNKAPAFHAGKALFDSVSTGGKKIAQKITPVTKELGTKTSQGVKDASSFIAQKASQGSADIKEGAGKMFSKLKNVKKK